MSFTHGFEKTAYGFGDSLVGARRLFGSATGGVKRGVKSLKAGFKTTGTKMRVAGIEGEKKFPAGSIGTTATEKSMKEFSKANPNASAKELEKARSGYKVTHQENYLKGLDDKKIKTENLAKDKIKAEKASKAEAKNAAKAAKSSAKAEEAANIAKTAPFYKKHPYMTMGAAYLGGKALFGGKRDDQQQPPPPPQVVQY